MMGIGRREFIRQFGAVIALVGTGPANAIAISDDQYINRKLGIAFRKPAGWTFADVKEMGMMKSGQILDLDDPHLAAQIVDSVEMPILTISREGISADSTQFTPGATVYLDRYSSPSTKPVEITPIVDCLHDDPHACARILKEFRVLKEPRILRVSECDAIEYEASFVFEHVSINPTRVRMKTLAIEHRFATYTFRMYDAPSLGDGFDHDFTPFISSIRLI